MSFIRRQYELQETELRVRDDGVLPGPHREQRVVVPVNGINRAVVQAVNFGRALSPRRPGRLRHRRPRAGRRAARALGAPAPGRARWSSSSRRTVRSSRRSSPTSTSSTRPGRRTRRRRSRSSSCPSTSPATGGTGCCITRPPNGSRPPSSGASTRSSPTSRTGAGPLTGRADDHGAHRSPLIGGRRPLQGRKPADRRVRVERPHAPVLPLHRARPARRQAGRQRRPHPDRPVLRARARRRLRPAAVERGGDRRAPVTRRKALAIFSSDAISSSAYATEEILRVLVLAGASAHAPVDPGRDRDRRPARGRVAVVPPGLPGLPERRRRVRRGQDQPGPDLRADRRGRPAHRLRHDGLGVDRRRDRPDPVGHPGRRTTSASRSRSSRSR